MFTSSWTGPATIEVCDAPHHLLLTTGAEDESQVEAWLTTEGAQTRLVVEERGLPVGLAALLRRRLAGAPGGSRDRPRVRGSCASGRLVVGRAADAWKARYATAEFPVRNGRTNVSFTITPLSTLTCPGNQQVVIDSVSFDLTLRAQGINEHVTG